MELGELFDGNLLHQVHVGCDQDGALRLVVTEIEIVLLNTVPS